MGHGFQHILGISRLAYFGGVVFAVIIILQYFEFPYGDVISSLFSASKIHISYGTNRTSSNCTTDNATTALTSPQIFLHSNMSETHKNASNLVRNFTKNESPTRDIFPSVNLSAVTEVHRKKQKAKVVSISEMHDILIHNRASSHPMKSLWTSRADQELLNAKLQIGNASFNEDDRTLYPSVFRNISKFRRSYELMEKTLKVYIYKEGEKPIFHQPEAVMKGIYASEGWFMMQMKSSKRFITKKPKQAHLFYIPYSSKLLKATLFPNSYNRESVVPYLKSYIDMISRRYNFWNRTGGADHFLVACHDWAPDETRQFMGTCIRAICNNDVQKSGFELGKDVSLPETNVRYRQNPLQNRGGNPPSKRSVFAFFAGKMHGYLRPILLRHWENKDPDMKIFSKLPKVKDDKNYVDFMKNSKFCICAKGSEVNSPRVVEAIFYECVPVIISDNFVPPFFEILDWESFAVFVPEKDIPDLKNILLSIPKKRYLQMHQRVKEVQQHFLWHVKPVKYDIFHMILHSIWYTRVARVM
ncbi:putative xylogalacturonan beta-1,3-xylosyltransferase [Helianthus annuus]|nr:putative xylogalacturonan beta-1,3-xylosyltransferase [Helianthus annuus]